MGNTENATSTDNATNANATASAAGATTKTTKTKTTAPVSLDYPFDSNLILRKKASIRRQLLAQDKTRIKKRIAVLGGSSTQDIVKILELFLLNYDIEPEFYECEYGRYYEELMFPNPELEQFAPDIIFIHTSYRNIAALPQIGDTRESAEALLNDTFARFQDMWDHTLDTYRCPIIQNNFDQPPYRLLGNRDAYDHRGAVNFTSRLNALFADYAAAHEGFYLNDLNWLSAQYGLKAWQDPFYWHMYKYALCVPAIPEFAFNVANIIKSVYGKNKKVLALDLDNTLWGGIVGDDGPEGIEIGMETSKGQMFLEFQRYVAEQKKIGVMLAVDSKNDEENALAGLNKPECVLSPDDFIVMKANWDPKDLNLRAIAQEINVGLDSVVFIDDNPAERAIVRGNAPEASVPEIGEPHEYISIIDRSGFFEATNFSDDDLKRNEMYKANIQRQQSQSQFENYEDYLRSLEMTAVIAPFEEAFESRIAQLTNKTNQFNLTTRRCTLSEIQEISKSDDHLTLYGKLIDKFGDNGVVTVVFGHFEGTEFHVDLWLMSCRVLKRDMEQAMMDELVARCIARGATRIVGRYLPTKKNKMVSEFYAQFGFAKTVEDSDGATTWVLDDLESYSTQNKVIEVTRA